MSLAEPAVAPLPRTAAGRSAPAEELLHAAEALTRPVASPVTCEDAGGCARPGSVSLVSRDTVRSLCEMHAMTAVFTTGDLVALVKPAE